MCILSVFNFSLTCVMFCVHRVHQPKGRARQEHPSCPVPKVSPAHTGLSPASPTTPPRSRPSGPHRHLECIQLSNTTASLTGPLTLPATKTTTSLFFFLSSSFLWHLFTSLLRKFHMVLLGLSLNTYSFTLCDGIISSFFFLPTGFVWEGDK